MNRLRQFWRYTEKVFDLPARLRAIRDQRSQPEIPTRVLSASLFLAALLRVPSLLQLQAETQRRGWQRLVGWPQVISDDAFGYGLERCRLEDWRAVLVALNRTLKANKAFAPAKINGLLVVALDANEQFHSRCRCCPDCGQRRVEVKDAAGQTQTVTEYYHRQVYAQLHGPQFSVILDLEPMRPGEDEAAAALRMLGRMRRLYGPRFFDVLTVDAWYATGPFLRAVQKLGWGVVSVLKQERYEIYQEATALSREQTPQAGSWENRQSPTAGSPGTGLRRGGPGAGSAGGRSVDPTVAPRRTARRDGAAKPVALGGQGIGRLRAGSDLADRTPALGRGKSCVQRADAILLPDALSAARAGRAGGLAVDSRAGIQPV
jgi:hypothetical protein